MPKGIPKNAVPCVVCGSKIASPKDQLCPIHRSGATRQKYEFTPERDALLRAAYAQPTLRALSAKLAEFARLTNIPRDSVKWRCRKLGLRFSFERKPWNRAEVNMLLDMAGEFPICKIADRIGRTHSAVRVKLALLGHSGRISCDGFTITELAIALGVSRTTVNHWTMRGWLKSCDGVYSSANVRKFLREHLQELNLARVDQAWLKGELAEMMRGAHDEMAA